MLFLSRFPLLWPSGLCTWGLRSRLYSGRPPLVYAPRNTCKNARFRSSSLQFPSSTHIPPCPLSCPYLSLSPSLPYSLRPSISLSCLVFSRAVPTRFTSAMLFAHPLYHTLSLSTRACLINPVLSPIYRPLVFIVLVFFPLFARSLRKICPSLLELFSFSNSLNFDASSQGVGKN
jgi:hypothetical protein